MIQYIKCFFGYHLYMELAAKITGNRQWKRWYCAKCGNYKTQTYY